MFARRARRRSQLIQRAGDCVGCVAHGLVATDQIGIRIDQHDVVIAETASAVQVEEHGAAADKWLDVAVEGARIQAAEMRQQLPLAAGPFQKRTGCKG